MIDRLSELHDLIAEVAPIHGVQSGNPPVIDFKPEATAQQISDANAVLASFDLNVEPRPIVDIYQDIQGLSVTDFKKLTAAALVFFLKQRPTIAKNFGINIETTEPTT